MPIFEYILVALLGSGGSPSAPPSVTLGADAIVQPNGGVLLAGPEQDKKEDIKYRNKIARTKHRRHPIKPAVTPKYTPKKDG